MFSNSCIGEVFNFTYTLLFYFAPNISKTPPVAKISLNAKPTLGDTTFFFSFCAVGK